MRTGKKVLALLLAVFLCAGLLPTSALAAKTYVYDFEVTLTNTGKETEVILHANNSSYA